MRLALRIGVLGLLVVVAAGLLVYRDTYANWPWHDAPDRLRWCGRDYNHTPGFTSRGPSKPLHPVFRAPPVIGRQVYALVTAGEAERRREAGEVCEFSLYVRVGDDRYAPYGLSGGP